MDSVLRLSYSSRSEVVEQVIKLDHCTSKSKGNPPLEELGSSLVYEEAQSIDVVKPHLFRVKFSGLTPKVRKDLI